MSKFVIIFKDVLPIVVFLALVKPPQLSPGNQVSELKSVELLVVLHLGYHLESPDHHYLSAFKRVHSSSVLVGTVVVHDAVTPRRIRGIVDIF